MAKNPVRMTEDLGKKLHDLIVALDELKAEVKGWRVEMDARKLEIAGTHHALRRLRQLVKNWFPALTTI